MKYKNDIIAVIIVLGFLGLISFYYLNLTKVTDASKFKEEYSNVSEDNVFVYRTDKEIIDILKHGTGIVYLGFPECPWCQAYVSYLDEVAKETKIEKIYYLNILEIRKNNTKEYQEIVSLLDNYLSYDEEGKKRIYVPAIVAVKEGEIIGFDDETSHDTKGYETPEEYWKNEDLDGLKAKLEKMFSETVKNVCTTDCNK
ncbi:MAG: hypothetical protein ACI4WF_00735 [Bacilli bacterium]